MKGNHVGLDALPGVNSVIREYSVVGNLSKANGRSTVTIKCPFCGIEVVAYKWSLCGCGKKCPCGALFDAHGKAVKEENGYG